MVLTVSDGFSYEGVQSCPSGAGTCTVRDGTVQFIIGVSGWSAQTRKNQPFTVTYAVVSGTATAGQDTAAPTTGSITVPANAAQVYQYVTLVQDGVAEPTETFTLRLTSASVPADLTDTGTGTIDDGTQIPSDCTASKTDDHVMLLTCTGRPPTQTWHLRAVCASILGGYEFEGNPVTGAGVSTVDCGSALVYNPVFIIDA
jgi:Calx-beta domain-containing protein